MDYYQVLRIAPNASRKEIEQAYQRLLKEARYDTSIDRLQVENAYRILTDLVAKNRYDVHQNFKTKRETRHAKNNSESRGSFNLIEKIRNLTIHQLLVILAVTVAVAMAFYWFRFGYKVKAFQAGDVIYDSISHKPFGKILRVESNHAFGSKQMDAYHIELNPALDTYGSAQKTVWLPQDNVKARCYKK